MKKLVLFTSPNCPPCKVLKDYLNTNFPELVYDSVSPQDDFELAMNYQVRSTPTLLLLDKDGIEQQRLSGFSKSENEIEKLSKMIFQVQKF